MDIVNELLDTDSEVTQRFLVAFSGDEQGAAESTGILAQLKENKLVVGTSALLALGRKARTINIAAKTLSSFLEKFGVNIPVPSRIGEIIVGSGVIKEKLCAAFAKTGDVGESAASGSIYDVFAGSENFNALEHMDDFLSQTGGIIDVDIECPGSSIEELPEIDVLDLL